MCAPGHSRLLSTGIKYVSLAHKRIRFCDQHRTPNIRSNALSPSFAWAINNSMWTLGIKHPLDAVTEEQKYTLAGVARRIKGDVLVLAGTEDHFVPIEQVAQFEKASMVAKLRHARDRKRAATGRCEGRKPIPAEVLAEARRLARRNPKTGRKRSLREIAAELATAGYNGPSGAPYFPASIARMLSSATGPGRQPAHLAAGT